MISTANKNPISATDAKQKRWYGNRFHNTRYLNQYKKAFTQIKKSKYKKPPKPTPQKTAKNSKEISQTLLSNSASKLEWQHYTEKSKDIAQGFKTLLESMTQNSQNALTGSIYSELRADLENPDGKFKQFYEDFKNSHSNRAYPRLSSGVTSGSNAPGPLYTLFKNQYGDCSELEPLFNSSLGIDVAVFEVWLSYIIAMNIESLMKKSIFYRHFSNQRTICNRSLQGTYVIIPTKGVLAEKDPSWFKHMESKAVGADIYQGVTSDFLMFFRAYFIYFSRALEYCYMLWIFGRLDRDDWLRFIGNELVWGIANNFNLIDDYELMKNHHHIHGIFSGAIFTTGSMFTILYGLADWLRDVYIARRNYKKAREKYLALRDAGAKEAVIEKAEREMEEAKRALIMVNQSDSLMFYFRLIISNQCIAAAAHASQKATLMILLPVTMLLITATLSITLGYLGYQALKNEEYYKMALCLTGLAGSLGFFTLSICALAGIVSAPIIFHMFAVALMMCFVGSVAYTLYRLYTRDPKFFQKKKRQLALAGIGIGFTYIALVSAIALVTILAPTIPLWGILLVSAPLAAIFGYITYKVMKDIFKVNPLYAKRFAIEFAFFGVVLGGLIIALIIGAPITVVIGLISALAGYGLYWARSLGRTENVKKPQDGKTAEDLGEELKSALSKAKAANPDSDNSRPESTQPPVIVNNDQMTTTPNINMPPKNIDIRQYDDIKVMHRKKLQKFISNNANCKITKKVLYIGIGTDDNSEKSIWHHGENGWAELKGQDNNIEVVSCEELKKLTSKKYDLQQQEEVLFIGTDDKSVKAVWRYRADGWKELPHQKKLIVAEHISTYNTNNTKLHIFAPKPPTNDGNSDYTLIPTHQVNANEI